MTGIEIKSISSPFSPKISLIGRAKQAPHWAVQSRFRVIYIYVGIYVYDCLWETHTKKLYATMHGWIMWSKHVHAQISFASLKQSAAWYP